MFGVIIILIVYVPIFALSIVVEFSTGPVVALFFAMLGDAADYSEWRNGRRATGLVFSAATFAQKFGIALGGGAAGWLLAGFGFVANAEQSPETLRGIRLMMSFIPGARSLMMVVMKFTPPIRELIPRMESPMTQNSTFRPGSNTPEVRLA